MEQNTNRTTERIAAEYTVNEVIDAGDTRFLSIYIDVLHLGVNYNGSVFTKEVVDRNAHTIQNMPILGYITTNPQGEKDFKGHECQTVTENGETKVVYAGRPYGVVPESCNPRWVKKVSSDGVEREYFRVDGLLWTRFQDAAELFANNGGKPQSMELEADSIQGEELEDGTFRVDDFQFAGCCLLSSTDPMIEPAMIDSVAAPNYTASSMAREIVRYLNQYQEMKEKKEKEGKTVENTENFTLTNNGLLEAIGAELDKRQFMNQWGDMIRQYNYVDLQDSEVIVMDRKNHWFYYGIPYSMNGDLVTLDFDNMKRKKIVFSDLEDGEEGPTSSVFEKVYNEVIELYDARLTQVTEEKETAETNYQSMKQKVEEMEPKLNAYAKKEAEMEKARKAELFEKFDSVLSDDADYLETKKNVDNLSVAEVETQCARIYTAKKMKLEFSHENRTMATPVLQDESRYEMTERYGMMPKK